MSGPKAIGDHCRTPRARGWQVLAVPAYRGRQVPPGPPSVTPRMRPTSRATDSPAKRAPPSTSPRTVAMLFASAAVVTTTQHNGADWPAEVWKRCGGPPVTLAVLDDTQTRQPGREVDLVINWRQDLVNLRCPRDASVWLAAHRIIRRRRGTVTIAVILIAYAVSVGPFGGRLLRPASCTAQAPCWPRPPGGSGERLGGPASATRLELRDQRVPETRGSDLVVRMRMARSRGATGWRHSAADREGPRPGRCSCQLACMVVARCGLSPIARSGLRMGGR
jgi:hypothetical protein